MAKTYLTKATVKPVGVSKVRTFGGPVDLEIQDKTEGVLDNFPMGLTAFDLFGAVIKLVDDTKTVFYIADAVYEDASNVYFTLGMTNFSYSKADGRITFV